MPAFRGMHKAGELSLGLRQGNSLRHSVTSPIQTRVLVIFLMQRWYQLGSRAARSSGTRKISRRPSLPAISSPRPDRDCRSLRAV
jgi:hypothetical protein